MDLGFLERTYTFNELLKGQFNYHERGYYQLYFGLSPDINMHSRSIYTIWDLLGGIGGLIDMLRLIIRPILASVSLAFSTGLETYLVQAIFYE